MLYRMKCIQLCNNGVSVALVNSTTHSLTFDRRDDVVILIPGFKHLSILDLEEE